MPTSKATIIEAGHTRSAVAKTWPTKPSSGQRQVRGTFNSVPYTFVLTTGKGQGTVTQFYAYVEIGGRVWYIDTGDGFLSEGAAVQFSG
ncbi:hypothetical protein [Paraburkholderia saeva]|uniref:hypothetical protein n=1 Tax=Paraburkholderia saeva TaxID=2777537 RepID=UPI001E1AAEC4|nr:hypothetical protein [Paraburkholderia saeva]CAG4900344.1 hypothetical protein R52603_02729 [Paraburkholderia saeva]